MSVVEQPPRPSAPVRRIPGEGGVWVLIFGDLVIFALMFGAVILMRADDPATFAASQDQLLRWLGIVNTVLLLTSSLAVARGVQAVVAGQGRVARRLFLAGFACGAGFVALKIFNYVHDASAGLVPAANEFFALFYVFTGIHLLHVVLGLCVLAFMARACRRAVPPRRLIESGASFWHLVDLLWVVLFALFYLLP